MLSRAFVVGLLAVFVPAGGLALAIAVDEAAPPARLPVNTVQGAPAQLGPPLAGGIVTRPLAPTPPPSRKRHRGHR